MRVLLVGLGDAETLVIRILEAHGHVVAIRTADESNEPHWLEEAYDLIVDRRPGPGWVGFTSWAASACGGAFILTVVNGLPDEKTIAALLAAGTDDVIARSALEHFLGERVLIVEVAVFRRSARRISEAVTVPDVAAQAERRDWLQELAEELSTTIDSIGDAVVACDAGGAVTRMNPVAEHLTGWPLAEAKGRPLDDIFKIFDSHTRAPVESPVARALREGGAGPLGLHWILARRDGTDLPIADSCATIKGANGHVRGAVLVFRDVSAEHRAREPEEKAKRQLFVAERMASVGTLAAGAAHEINNPLAYVITNLDVALDEIRALSGRPTSARLEGLGEMMREARDGAERVRLIVRGLKTFSRTEEELRTVVELRPVLELAAVMTANEIRHRAHLVEDFGPAPLVEVDAARLGQVFINLLVNAAQALPDGHSETNEIRITTSTDEQGRAVVEIADTGPGIPSSVLDRVFDPFFTTKAVGVGTGLGLSISRNIVNSLGGEIAAHSEEGRGTTFRIVLPPAAVQKITKRIDSVNPSAPVGARILVVDDEVALGKALRRVLSAHEVTILTRAKDALDLLATGKTFDVIFSDLMMPEMSGMEFHKEANRLFPDAADRMVFVTGGAFTPDAIAFLARVPNERLEKPFDPENVRALVHNLCKPRKIPSRSGTVELRPGVETTGSPEGRQRRAGRGSRLG